MVHLGNDWDEILAGEFEQDYYKRIRYWLKKEYAEPVSYTHLDVYKRQELNGVTLLGSQKNKYPSDYAPEMLE